MGEILLYTRKLLRPNESRVCDTLFKFVFGVHFWPFLPPAAPGMNGFERTAFRNAALVNTSYSGGVGH